eukprot:160788_1
MGRDADYWRSTWGVEVKDGVDIACKRFQVSGCRPAPGTSVRLKRDHGRAKKKMEGHVLCLGPQTCYVIVHFDSPGSDEVNRPQMNKLCRDQSISLDGYVVLHRKLSKVQTGCECCCHEKSKCVCCQLVPDEPKMEAYQHPSRKNTTFETLSYQNQSVTVAHLTDRQESVVVECGPKRCNVDDIPHFDCCPPILESAALTLSGNGGQPFMHGDHALATCQDGHLFADGQRTKSVRCTDGKWSEKELPEIEVHKVCSLPSVSGLCFMAAVEDGSGVCTSEPNTIADSAHIVAYCTRGGVFEEGASTRTLQCRGGQWVPNPATDLPKCLKPCRSPPHKDGYTFSEVPPVSRHGTTTEAICNFGFFQNGDRTALVTCINGVWSGVEDLTDCKLPATITIRFTMPVSFIDRQKLEKQIRHALMEALNEPDERFDVELGDQSAKISILYSLEPEISAQEDSAHHVCRRLLKMFTEHSLDPDTMLSYSELVEHTCEAA